MSKKRHGAGRTDEGRGRIRDRQRRRRWLLNTYGDGVEVACALGTSPLCLGMLTNKTMTVDRITPGCCGGTYRYVNIRPACAPCNTTRKCSVGHGTEGTMSA